jgi:aminopeptidase N
LKDFVGCLVEAYNEQNKTNMGQKFDFKEWCDSWLTTKGINNLEPVIEYDKNHTIKSFQIKQSNEKTQDNRMRKQLIDIAVYDDKYQPHVIENVLIDDKMAMNTVNHTFNFPVKAVLLNHDDHAYAKIRYDNFTIMNLQKDLEKVNDTLQHQMIWNQLFYHVMDQKMSSVGYFNFIISQLPKAKSMNVILDTLKQLQTTVDIFIPLDKVEKCQKLHFETLMTML